MASFAPMTEASQKYILVLDQILCIYYLIWFKKNKIQGKIQALINSGNEVNTITSEYASKLGLKICFIDVKAQKIDNSTLKTFEIVLTSFQVEDKLRKSWFFQKAFLLADFNIEIVVKILFLTFSNANIKFT